VNVDRGDIAARRTPGGGGERSADRRDVVPLSSPRVLMYHFFGDQSPTGDPERLFIGREEFAAHLAELRRGGWHPLDLDGYLAALTGAPTAPRSYLLTIDDGHQSVIKIAAPMLAEVGIPSVLFVCPGRLGDLARWSDYYPDEPLANAEEILTLPGLGMELGVHGMDHTPTVCMDDAALNTQIVQSRTDLEALIGTPARSFAYPFGKHDAAARDAVAAAGFDVSFAVAREAGRFAVDRVFVRRGDPLLLFRFKLSTAYRLISRLAGRMSWLRRQVPTVVRLLGSRRRGLVRRGPATPGGVGD
jgi:peptidoglycan/xylan/chitin deacetylase (PgdA/CDA1 family)